MAHKMDSREKSARAANREAERKFLATYDVAAYERPSLSVDVVLLTMKDGELRTLLVRRREHPFQDAFALPGGFVGVTEELEDAAKRLLAKKAGLGPMFLEQLYTFGRVGRDPRTRVVSVAYYALVDAATFDHGIAQLASGDSGGELLVASLRAVEAKKGGDPMSIRRALVLDARGKRVELAFDHADILTTALVRLRGKIEYAPVGYQLLPELFTLLDLQQLHETVLGRVVNKHSFRRKMLASGDLVGAGQLQEGVDHRPAELFRFVRRSAL